MKNLVPLLSLGAAAILLPSCAQQLSHKTVTVEPVTYVDENGDSVTTYARVSRVTGDAPVAATKSAPAAAPSEAISAVAVDNTTFVENKTVKAYKPKYKSKQRQVRKQRYTAQGGTGVPHIGLVPTMKTLVPKKQ